MTEYHTRRWQDENGVWHTETKLVRDPAEEQRKAEAQARFAQSQERIRAEAQARLAQVQARHDQTMREIRTRSSWHRALWLILIAISLVTTMALMGPHTTRCTTYSNGTECTSN